MVMFGHKAIQIWVLIDAPISIEYTIAHLPIGIIDCPIDANRILGDIMNSLCSGTSLYLSYQVTFVASSRCQVSIQFFFGAVVFFNSGYNSFRVTVAFFLALPQFWVFCELPLKPLYFGFAIVLLTILSNELNDHVSGLFLIRLLR